MHLLFTPEGSVKLEIR